MMLVGWREYEREEGLMELGLRCYDYFGGELEMEEEKVEKKE